MRKSDSKLMGKRVGAVIMAAAMTLGMTMGLAGCGAQEQGNVQQSSQAEQSFTSLIKEDVSKLHTKEELAEYLRSAAGRFGRFHNNAYRLFQQRLHLLEKPEPSYFDDEPTELTIRDILRDYMYESNVSYAKERARRTRKGEI